jgi:uncharacterized membrane protein YfcA
VDPSQRGSPVQSANRWLDQRQAWQFALIMACITGLAAAAAATAVQWTLHGHLDPGTILATAAGIMIGCFAAVFCLRLARTRHH